MRPPHRPDGRIALANITLLQLGLSAAIDSGRHAAISLADMKSALGARNVFEWLATRLPDTDFTLYLDKRDNIGRTLTRLLSDADERFSGRERRKLGIENSGICYLLSLTVELVHSNMWKDHRVWEPTRY